MRVFISYRRNDSPDVAGRIHDRLVESFGGGNVYYDVDSIPFGVDFRHHIDSMIMGCDAVLVVIGPRWLRATRGGQRQVDDPLDFVRAEVEAALHRDILVVPVLVHGADIPPPEQLPESIQALAYRHGLPVRQDPDFHGDMSRLIKSLATTASPPTEAVVGGDTASPAERSEPPLETPTTLLSLPEKPVAPPPKESATLPAPRPTQEAALAAPAPARRWRTPMLVGGIVVIVAVVGWLLTRSDGSPGESARPAGSVTESPTEPTTITPQPSAFAMTDVLPTVGNPADLKVDGSHLLITLASGVMQRIDPMTKAVVGEADFGFDPGGSGVLVNPDELAVISHDCRVGFVDTAFGQEEVIEVSGDPPAENTLGTDGFWFGCRSDEVGFVSHIVDRKEVGRIYLEYIPYGVFTAGNYLYIAFADDNLLGKVDLRTGTVDAVVQVGALPVDVLLINDSLWVTLGNSDEVAVLNPATLEIRARYAAGDEPWKLAYGLGSVWVTNRSKSSSAGLESDVSGTVSRLDPNTGQRQQEDIPVGHRPDEIVVADQVVYVANVDDANISILRAA